MSTRCPTDVSATRASEVIRTRAVLPPTLRLTSSTASAGTMLSASRRASAARCASVRTDSMEILSLDVTMSTSAARTSVGRMQFVSTPSAVLTVAVSRTPRATPSTPACRTCPWWRTSAAARGAAPTPCATTGSASASPGSRETRTTLGLGVRAPGAPPTWTAATTRSASQSTVATSVSTPVGTFSAGRTLGV